MSRLAVNFVLGFVAIALFAAPTAAAPNEAVVTLLDGSEATGTLINWSNDALQIQTGDGPRNFDRQQLLNVRWERKTPPGSDETAAPSAWLELLDGSRIAMTEYSAARRIASIKSPHADKPIRVSTGQVNRVHFMTNDAAAPVWQQISERQVAGDVLLVTTRDGAALDYLVGVVGDVSADSVAFTYDGQDMAVKRTKVAGIGYFHAGLEEPAPSICLLTLDDGSRLAVEQIAFDAQGALAVRTPSGARMLVPLSRVDEADYSAGKLAYLSDLKPESVTWTPRIGVPAAATLIANYGLPRHDESFAGEALTLAWSDESQPSGQEVRTYAKGLAIRSGTQLAFEVPEGMTRFAALAGIDPATARQGHVVLQIRADNRVVWENEIDGTAAPEPIELELGAARRLQLSVDYGRNLDFGDRLHLVEARLIK